MNAATRGATVDASGPSAQLARLPLLVGTSCAWNATAAALTLLPAIAFTVFPLIYDAAIGALVAAIILVALTLPFIIYAIASLGRSVRARASDIVVELGGVWMQGGTHHGRRVAWGELVAPFAQVEATTEMRFRLPRLLFGAFLTIASLVINGLLIALAMGTRSSAGLDSFVWFGSPWKRKEIQIWRFWVFTGRERMMVGTTDREIEAQSMQAAAESIEAVMSGRRYVEEAPRIPARIVSCRNCGAPAVPSEAPAIACMYCRAAVPMPPEVRQQAAAVQAMKASRATSEKIVAKLVKQPRAGRVNVRLLLLVAFMFLAWPIGWGIVAPSIIGDGWEPLDLVFLLMPFAAVLSGCFLARAGLADRGALQLLTLGFGALAPRRDGEPARCRRCQGPLQTATMGGVVQCVYCAADNIVGLDLRPTVGPARAEQATFDAALATRNSDKTTWAVLSVVAVFVLVAWLGGSIAYVVNMYANTQ